MGGNCTLSCIHEWYVGTWCLLYGTRSTRDVDRAVWNEMFVVLWMFEKGFTYVLIYAHDGGYICMLVVCFLESDRPEVFKLFGRRA